MTVKLAAAEIKKKSISFSTGIEIAPKNVTRRRVRAAQAKAAD